MCEWRCLDCGNKRFFIGVATARKWDRFKYCADGSSYEWIDEIDIEYTNDEVEQCYDCDSKNLYFFTSLDELEKWDKEHFDKDGNFIKDGVPKKIMIDTNGNVKEVDEDEKDN